MKKEYIKPEMEMEEMLLENMIAASVEVKDEDEAEWGSPAEGKNRNDNWGGLLW